VHCQRILRTGGFVENPTKHGIGHVIQLTPQGCCAVGGLSGDAPADQVAHVEHQGQRDGVDRAVPVLAAGDHTGCEEDSKLLGDVGLFETGLVDKFSNARRARLKDLEDAKPRRLGENAEELRDRLKLGIVQRFVINFGVLSDG
jgi:hypothetical protein